MHLTLSYLALATAVTAQSNLVSTLESQSDLSTFLGAVSSIPGLADVLGSSRDITILAPTNEAFEAIPTGSRVGQALSNDDTDVIGALLAYHVLVGNYSSSTIEETPQFVHSLLNSTYTMNGMALADVTGGQNVELLTNMDTVSILSGELAQSDVTEADIYVDGITIHKINRVLTIPDTISTTALLAGLTVAAVALTKAELVETVDTTSDVTIFVPNNEAFEAVGSALQNASLEDLATVLQYHVVSGTVLFSTDVTNTTVDSLQGAPITLNSGGDTIFVNNAKVVIPNIIVANGVAHVIDGVLNPESSSVDTSSLSPTSTGSVAFSGATSVSDIPFTSGGPTPTSTLIIPAVVTEAPVASSESGQSSTTTSEGAAAMATAAANFVGAGLFIAGALIL